VIDDLDFELSPDELGDTRRSLFREAGDQLDAAAGHLKGGGGGTTEEGDWARAFDEDEAQLKPPEVFRIDESRLNALREDMPVELVELTRLARFYWLSFPVALWASEGRGFNQVQVKMEFNPDDEEARRPATFDILPDNEFTEKFNAQASVKVGLGANLKFAAVAPVGVEAQTDLALGPFTYELRALQVKRSAEGYDYARWRLDGAKFIQEHDPGLRVVLRVPRDVDRLVIRGHLRARRYYSMLDARFMKKIVNLPAKLVSLFGDGAPIGDVRTWDVSHAM